MLKNNNTKKKENKAAVLVLLLLPYILFIAALVLLYSTLWSFAVEKMPILSIVITAPSDTTSTRDYTPVIITPPKTNAVETIDDIMETESETFESDPEIIQSESEITQPDLENTESEPETEAVADAPAKIKETAPQSNNKTQTTKIITERSMETFPKIRYGEQWATLNVDGWAVRNIPVYCGDTDEILSYGVGMSYSSRFIGQNGKTVISGHVTSHFYEIEDTEPGDYITVDTIYAHYVYEVKELLIFDYKDNSIMLTDDSGDTLILYTCYPRTDGLAFKDERIAIVADMIEGARYVW